MVKEGRVDREKQFLEEVVALRVKEFEESYRMEMAVSIQDLQSPIERIMAMALIYSLHIDRWFSTTPFQFSYESSWNYALPNPSLDDLRAIPSLPGIIIWPQVSVGKYKADFILRFSYSTIHPLVWAAVECDGHDYHDRTKKQAIHDRERDRFFQSCDLMVFRYTGSEIWANPTKCARQAIGIMRQRARTQPVQSGEVK